jgi:hypothetical protein
MILIGIGFIFTDNKNLDIFGLIRESGGGYGTYQSRENTRGKSFSEAGITPQIVSAPVSLVAVGNFPSSDMIALHN